MRKAMLLMKTHYNKSLLDCTQNRSDIPYIIYGISDLDFYHIPRLEYYFL